MNEMLENEHKPITQLISKAIKLYTSQDNQSLRKISHYTGISFGYTRRLSLEEIKEDKLDPVKLFQVAKFVKGTEFAYSLIDHRHDWLHKIKIWTGLDRKFNSKSNENKEIEDNIIEDENTIVAFMLSLNEGGTSNEQLLDIGGNSLVRAARKLQNKKILNLELGYYKYIPVTNSSDNHFFTFSREALIRIAPVLLKYYDKEHSGKLRNFLSISNQGYSVEFLAQIQVKMFEFKKWLDEESEKSQNKGSNPTFVGLFMDTFTNELRYGEDLSQ